MTAVKQEKIIAITFNLYKAVECNNIEEVKDIIKRKRPYQNFILPQYGISSFHLAVGIDSVQFSEEVTRLFILHGGDPNVRSSEGLTPVHVAAFRGRLENLHLLLSAGGNPLAVDNDGCSPMYYAYKEGNHSCVELLQSFKHKLRGRFTPRSYNEESSVSSETEENNSVEQKAVSRPSVRDPFLDWRQPAFHLADISEERDSKVINDTITSPLLPAKEILDTSGSKLIKDTTTAPLLPWKERVDVPPKEESVLILDNEPCPDSFHYEKQLLDCWLASQSCFSKANKISNYINSEISEKDVCDNVDPEKNILDVSFKILNINSSKESNSNDNSVSNLTYDITDKDNFLHRTYNIFCDSILSSDRSSPIMRDRNISFERNAIFQPIFLNRTNSESSLSCISPLSERKNQYVTYRKKDVLNGISGGGRFVPVNESESEDYFTVPEENNDYTDEEKGVHFLERRASSVMNSNFNILSNIQPKMMPKDSRVPRSSSEYSLSSYNTEDLRNEVRKAVSFGCCCPLGPITASTKRVYLRKVHNFKKEMTKKNMEPFSKPAIPIPKFSNALERTLAEPWLLSHSKYIQIEQRMMAQFDERKKFNHWREGSQKCSFNYLLLDPRITNNIPLRWSSRTKRESLNYMGEAQNWKDFLTSIFYVGKGKRSRPYSHLYEAVSAWRDGNSSKKVTKKIKHILNIWKENAGVVCLHVFQNAIPAEAFTREAAMIDALGLKNLKNERRGDYYGIVSSLSFTEKREFGSFLLYRAMMIYLNEGERQLKPEDIE